MGALIWAFLAAGDAASILGHREGLPSGFSPGDALYKKFGDIYTALSVFGLSVAAGLSFTVLAWERRSPRWHIELVFWILIALALPMSVLNYWSEDTFVSRSQQFYLNFAQVFLAGVCALQLTRKVVSTDSGIVLKSLALFCLLAFGVFIPLIFSVLWFLNWEKAIDLATSKSVTPGWVSAISGIGALVVSFLQFRVAKAKQVADAEISPAMPRIIRP